VSKVDALCRSFIVGLLLQKRLATTNKINIEARNVPPKELLARKEERQLFIESLF
jgi:hypothetical protein